MIEKLELKNFTVFNDLKIDFSPKINVIIGENGTGKTHLLKAAYSICAAADATINNKQEVTEEDLQKAVTKKVCDVFMPLDGKIAKLRKTGSDGTASVKCDFEGGKSLSFTFHANSQFAKIIKSNSYERYSYVPVYIPTKEVLSFMEGFMSLYEKYQLSFDRTYYDICTYLDLPKAREETLNPKSKWVMEEIEKVVGGKFVFYGGGRVTFKAGNDEYSANAMAEGYRKIGMLSRLLETGAINPVASGPLFWDEPESNMNPKLLRLLVEILLELSRKGQQIIIATHEYVLLKWFDLLIDKGKEDQVRYHALYRDETTKQVCIDSTDVYQEVQSNSIAATYSELYDGEIDRSFSGGKGK